MTINQRAERLDLEQALVALANGHALEAIDLNAAVIKQLAEYGVEVVGGVLSMRQHEFLNVETIRARLDQSSRSWLQSLEVLTCTESTNTDLLEHSRSKAIDGWVRTAEVQTGGRGRRGRIWVSPFAKNIAMSIGISIDRPTAEVGSISLAVGALTAKLLDNLGIKNVKLKWPNDILIDEQKVGGILIELADAQRPATLVIGVGMNVHDAPGVDVTGSYRATRIVDHVTSCSRNVLAAELINGIHSTIRQFERSGFGAFKEQWEQRDVLKERRIVLTGVEPPINGIGGGIDKDGAYLIETTAGVERAIGGELSLRIASE